MIGRVTRSDAANSGKALFEQVAEMLEKEIRSGDRGAGERMPSIRTLAQSRNLSPDTVVRAYERLVAAGLLRSRRGSGFYVAGPMIGVSRGEHSPTLPGTMTSGREWLTLLRTDIDLARRPGTGILDWGAAESEEVARAVRAAARTLGGLPNDHADPRGYLPLRIEIERKLAAEGIVCTADDILTGAGATGVLNLIVRTLVRPGDVVLIEEPGPPLHLALLMSQGAQPVFIRRGPTGPDLDAVRDACTRLRPRLFLLSSVLQNPTGTSIPPHCAHDLLGIAENAGVTIIDDASMADLADGGSGRIAAAPLALLDRRRNVVHVGSFSPTFSPACRVGYLIDTCDLAERLHLFRPLQTLGNAVLEERTLYHFLAEGRYRRRNQRLARHIAKLRSLLLSRLGSEGFPSAQGAGPYVWQSLGTEKDSDRIARLMLSRGFLTAPARHFSFDASDRAFMRLNVTTTSDESIAELLVS